MKLETNEKWALGIAIVGLGGYWWLWRAKRNSGVGDIPARKWGWGPVGDIPAQKWGWGPTGGLGYGDNVPGEAAYFTAEGQVVPGVPLGNVVWQQYL